MHLVLLPGLDGTGRLFAPFLAALPLGIRTTVVAYPDSLKTFDQYLAFAVSAINRVPDYVLIAESFSGQLALRMLANPPVGLRAIVLVSTYSRMPRRWLARLVARIPSSAMQPLLPAGLSLAGLHGSTVDTSLLALEVLRDASWPAMANRLVLLAGTPAADPVKTAIPMLCLNASRDRLVPRACFASKALPQVDVAEIDGPHLLLQARPRQCWKTISAWLTDRREFSVQR